MAQNLNNSNNSTVSSADLEPFPEYGQQRLFDEQYEEADRLEEADRARRAAAAPIVIADEVIMIPVQDHQRVDQAAGPSHPRSAARPPGANEVIVVQDYPPLGPVNHLGGRAVTMLNSFRMRLGGALTEMEFQLQQYEQQLNRECDDVAIAIQREYDDQLQRLHDPTECIACVVNQRNVTLWPCYHMVLCEYHFFKMMY